MRPDKARTSSPRAHLIPDTFHKVIDWDLLALTYLDPRRASVVDLRAAAAPDRSQPLVVRRDLWLPTAHAWAHTTPEARSAVDGHRRSTGPIAAEAIYQLALSGAIDTHRAIDGTVPTEYAVTAGNNLLHALGFDPAGHDDHTSRLTRAHAAAPGANLPGAEPVHGPPRRDEPRGHDMVAAQTVMRQTVSAVRIGAVWQALAQHVGAGHESRLATVRALTSSLATQVPGERTANGPFVLADLSTQALHLAERTAAALRDGITAGHASPDDPAGWARPAPYAVPGAHSHPHPFPRPTADTGSPPRTGTLRQSARRHPHRRPGSQHYGGPPVRRRSTFAPTAHAPGDPTAAIGRETQGRSLSGSLRDSTDRPSTSAVPPARPGRRPRPPWRWPGHRASPRRAEQRLKDVPSSVTTRSPRLLPALPGGLGADTAVRRVPKSGGRLYASVDHPFVAVTFVRRGVPALGCGRTALRPGRPRTAPGGFPNASRPHRAPVLRRRSPGPTGADHTGNRTAADPGAAWLCPEPSFLSGTDTDGCPGRGSGSSAPSDDGPTRRPTTSAVANTHTISATNAAERRYPSHEAATHAAAFPAHVPCRQVVGCRDRTVPAYSNAVHDRRARCPRWSERAVRMAAWAHHACPVTAPHRTRRPVRGRVRHVGVGRTRHGVRRARWPGGHRPGRASSWPSPRGRPAGRERGIAAIGTGLLVAQAALHTLFMWAQRAPAGASPDRRSDRSAVAPHAAVQRRYGPRARHPPRFGRGNPRRDGPRPGTRRRPARLRPGPRRRSGPGHAAGPYRPSTPP
ncbi:hypothetical protein ACU686_35835 [Yinghuangia aomiensis]